MTVNFGILGAGRIGRVHARAVASVAGAQLVAIAEPVAEAAQAAARDFGVPIRTIDEIEADGDIGAVVICTPTDTHADLIERFVTAGKAVFCEKPVDLDLARVQRVLKVVADRGGRLMVGFNRRFDPTFRALKAAVDEGRVGKVEMVTITSRDPGPPPASYIARSGGIFRDMTIHDFDLARWLLPEPVETVIAAGSVLVDPAIGRQGDYDSANVILRCAGGQQATITNSRRAAYGYDQRLEVHGSKGAVSAGNMHEANVTVASADGFLRPPLLNFFMTRYTEAYAAEIAAFAEAVRTGGPMPTTGEDGLMALALAEAAVRSAASGRAVKMGEVL